MFTPDKKFTFFLICLGNIAISFNIAALTASVPVISQDLGLQDFQVARIISYYLIPYGVAALIYAPLTKVISYRRILSISFLIFGISSLVCALAQSLSTILLFRIGMGIGGAGIIPLGLLIIGEFFDKKVRGRLVGTFFSGSFFASVAGIILSGVAHWRWQFIIPFLISAVIVLGCYSSKANILKKIHGVSVNYLSVFQKPQLRNVCLFIFAISFLYHAVHKWFGVYLAREYMMDKFTISFFFILMSIGGFCGQMLGGIISDKSGRKAACVIGVAGLALATMALWGHYSFLILGLILTSLTLFWTIGHNGISTVLTDFADLDRPMIASLNSSVRFISGGLGFYISGFFVRQNFSLTFFVIGLLILILVFIINNIIDKHI